MVLDFRKRIAVLALGVILLLMIPLVAMQFSNEVVWTGGDFVAAFVLLFGTGLTYELLVRRKGDSTYRVAVALGLGTGLFLVWANLAVGVIGNENDPVNLMYLGVLAVALNGVIIARLRPCGMAYAMFATALSQVVVTIIALMAGMQHLPESSVSQILVVNGFFVELWVISGLMFRNVGAAWRASERSADSEERGESVQRGGAQVKGEGQGYQVTSDIISWTFCLMFVIVGVLNIFLVHPVPGIFYILVAIFYVPMTNVILKRNIGFSIPLALKFLFGLGLLWATLAVGDLAEILGL